MKVRLHLSLEKEIVLFLKKSMLAFISRISGALAVFLMQIFLARNLGVQGFGLFALSMTVISVMAVFGRFGLDTLILRSLSAYSHKNQMSYAGSYSDPVIKFLGLNSAVLVFLLIITSGVGANLIFGKPQLEPIFIAMSPLLFFMVVGHVLGDAFKAVGYSSLGVMVQNSLLPIIFMLGLIFLSDYWYEKAENAALLYSITSVAILLAVFSYWKRITSSCERFLPKSFWKELKKGVPLLLVSSGGLLVAWTDILVLGVFETDYSIGLYVAASKISMLTSLILVAVNAVVAPKYSSFLCSGDFKKLELYVNRVSFLTLSIAVLPTLLIVIYPGELLSIFGIDFKSAKNILIVLSIGQLINVGCGSVGYLLVMANLEIIVRNVIWLVAVVNLLLSIFLANLFGAIGVAYATAFSVSLWNLLLVYFVKKKLGFWMLGNLRGF